MLLQKDMVQKKTKKEIENMPKQQISAYLIDITQSDICKDAEYCNFLVKQLLSK